VPTGIRFIISPVARTITFKLLSLKQAESANPFIALILKSVNLLSVTIQFYVNEFSIFIHESQLVYRLNFPKDIPPIRFDGLAPGYMINKE